jgi:hypothetical protein
MTDKLTPLALDILLPDKQGEPESLFIALGKKPRQAVIAWVLNSRNQVRDALKQVGAQVDEDVAQSIIQASDEIKTLPADSDLKIVTLEGQNAQNAFDKAHPVLKFAPIEIVGTDLAGNLFSGND